MEKKAREEEAEKLKKTEKQAMAKNAPEPVRPASSKPINNIEIDDLLR